MEDEQAQKKFEELQKHLPFLDKVIEKLRINVREQPENPRTAQLDKMEMLHELLTNTGKKLRLESLLKCESVIIKLHKKIEKSSSLQEGLNYSANAVEEGDQPKSSIIKPTVSIPNVSNIPLPDENDDDDDDCVIVNFELPTDKRDFPQNVKEFEEKWVKRNTEEPVNNRGAAERIKIEHRDRREQPDKYGYQNRNENRDRYNSRDQNDNREYHKRHNFRDKHESRDVHRVKHSSRERTDSREWSGSRDRFDLQDRRQSRDRHDSRERRDFHKDRHEDRNQTRDKYDQHREKNDFHNDSRPRCHYDKLKDNNRSDSACSSRSNTSVTTENEAKIILTDKNQDSFSKSVFERLGDKLGVNVANISESRNLHVNVDNPKINILQTNILASNSKHGVKPDFTKTHVSPPINKHVNVSIRDVLKSSPLTDNDITDLINENITEESATGSKNFNTATAYGVGFRRGANRWDQKKVSNSTESNQLFSQSTSSEKNSELSHSFSNKSSVQLDNSRKGKSLVDKKIESSPELTSLEIVRKKFALLSKGSINVKSEQKSCDSGTPSLDRKPNLTSFSNNISLADHLTQAITKPNYETPENRFENTIIKDPRMQKRNHEQHVETQQSYNFPNMSTTSLLPTTSNVDPRLERITNTSFLAQQCPDINNLYSPSLPFPNNNITPGYSPDNSVQSGNNFNHNNNTGFSGIAEGFHASDSRNFPASNFMSVPNSFRYDMSERFNSRSTMQSSIFSNQSGNNYYPKNIWDLNNENYVAPQPNQDLNDRFFNNRIDTQNSQYANRDCNRYSPGEDWDLGDQNYAMSQPINDWNIKKDSLENNSNLFMSQKSWHSTNAIKPENISQKPLQKQNFCKNVSQNTSENSSRYSVSPKGSKDFPKSSSRNSYDQPHASLSKFNALQNDKSERIKYLESKKNKSECHTTYAEYKLAKARGVSQDKFNGKWNKSDNESEEVGKTDCYEKKHDKSRYLEETKKKEIANSRMKKDDFKKGEDERKRNKDSLQCRNDKNINIEEAKKKENVNLKSKNIGESKNKETEKSKTIEVNKKTITDSLQNKKNNFIVPKGSKKSTLGHDSEDTDYQTIDSNKMPSKEKETVTEKDDISTLPKISKEDINNLPNFQQKSLPKRRNSMIEYGSALQVDKEVLPFANTILYADIQCEERSGNKTSKLSERYASRNYESLAKIFQRTNDNCALSTQNIISGKRRSRTLVNFNEVQQALSVFRHKKNPTKKDPKIQNDAKKFKKENKEEEKVENLETPKENGSEMLEGFVQNILKPNANTEYIFGLLRNILPEEKLNLVKSIIESTNEEINTHSTGSKSKNLTNNVNPEIPCDEEDEEQVPKKRFKKRNELDRLNEDIRDMFISEGVITATGKRVCTLVSASCDSGVSKNIQAEEITEEWDDDDDVLHIKPKPKSKKIKEKALNRMRMQAKLNFSEKNKTPKNKEQKDIIKEIKKRKFTVKLTKLKFPQTEAKNVEESVTTSPGSPNVGSIKKKMQVKTPILKNKSKKKVLNNEKQVESLQKSTKGMYTNLFKRTRAKILEEDGIRNTDPRWHSLSIFAEKCVICEVNMKYPGTHYIQTHAENYVSRLAPTIIKKLREGAIGKVLFHKKTRTWQSFSRCPFCLQYGYKSISEWLEHFTIHTGEYFYQCSYCHRTGNKPNIIIRHIESGVCPKGKLIKEKIHNFQDRVVKGHVCNLCNFVQMHRHNVDRHYIEQHGVEKEKVKDLGFEVNLLDWNNVKTVKEKRAAALEKKALQQKFLLIFNEDGIEVEQQNNDEENNEEESEPGDSNVIENEYTGKIVKENDNISECATKMETDPNETLELDCYPPVETVLRIESDCELDSTVQNNQENVVKLEPQKQDISVENKENHVNETDNSTENLKNNVEIPEKHDNETEKITGNEIENKIEDKLVNAKEVIPLKVIKEEKEDTTVLVPVKSAVSTSNAFLPSHRDNDSPTINFTQKLLTIQQENTIEEESEMNKSPPVVSIAERLSQRLKSMEKQIVTPPKMTINSGDDHEGNKELSSEQSSNSKSRLTENSNYEISDYQNQDSDDDCWEDIEITEYQASNKNKPVKSTVDNKKKLKQNQKKLHRFYASNAIRAKKIKDSYMTNKNNKTISSKNKEVCTKNAIEDVSAIFRPINPEINCSNENSTEKDPLSNDEPFSPHPDSSNENTQNVTIISSGMKGGVNRISNIGFSKDQRDSYKFYCLCEFCTFLYSSESVGLENHCLSEHSKLLWKGFCYTCNKQVTPYESSLTIAQEIKHMLEYHVRDLEDNTTQDSTISIDELQPPRIKLRRLSGDCLSASTPVHMEQILPNNENDPLRNLKSLLSEPSIPFKQFESFTVPNLPTSTEEVPISDLQITNVRSLNVSAFSEIVPVTPKISNVFGGVRNFTIDQNIRSIPHRSLSKSPEPIVVSETRPISQAHKGKYLITQTVSTKFDDHGEISSMPEHDVNISLVNATTGNNLSVENLTNRNSSGITPTMSAYNYAINTENTTSNVLPSNKPTTIRDVATYRCMAKNCVFKTRVSVSMIDHLHFHQVRSFQTDRDYLRCYICDEYVDDKRLLVQHIDKHLKTNADTRKGISDSTTLPPGNSVTSVKKFPNADKALLEQLKEAIYGILSSKTIKQNELYRCIYKKCNRNCESSENFLSHLKDHALKQKNNGPYKCLYCKVKTSQIDLLLLHLKSHGIHQYFCYICTKSTSTTCEMQQHYNQVHGRINNGCVSMLYEPEPEDTDKISFYVWHVHYLTEEEVHQFAEKIISDWLPKKFQSKVIYNSSESEDLPLQAIFHKEVRCAECSYKTKVRTNMIRHLQMHKQGNVVTSHEGSRSDPVNPMPCLNSTERHFDKMTNLASSSLVTPSSSTINNISGAINTTSSTGTNNTSIATANITTDDKAQSSTIANEKQSTKLKVDYAFIPETRVYTCGVAGCQYLTLSEEIFRSHILTLHGDSSVFICPFCKEEVCKRGISIARILTHLRFHGKWLYQCAECCYVHYVKAVVRRHIHEKHITSTKNDINLISYNRALDWQCTTLVELINDDDTNTSDTAATETSTSTTVTEAEIEPNPTTSGIGSNNNKINKREIRWQCDLCDHFSKTHNLILSHCNTYHGYRHRYQCGLCPTGFRQIDPVMKHFKQNHIGQKVLLKTIFHREVRDPDLESSTTDQAAEQTNMETNTRPLWQRNDPQRVRHIRGILMEDEEETEQHRKRLRLDEYEDNLENS